MINIWGDYFLLGNVYHLPPEPIWPVGVSITWELPAKLDDSGAIPRTNPLLWLCQRLSEVMASRVDHFVKVRVLGPHLPLVTELERPRREGYTPLRMGTSGVIYSGAVQCLQLGSEQDFAFSIMTDSLLTPQGVILLQRNAKTHQENSLWWAIIKGSAIPRRNKGNDLESSGSHVESQQQTALGSLPMNLKSSYPRPTRRKSKPNSAFRRTKEKKLWPKTLNAFLKRPQGTGCLVSVLTRWLGLSSASNQILHHWVGASSTFSKILLSGVGRERLHLLHT